MNAKENPVETGPRVWIHMGVTAVGVHVGTMANTAKQVLWLHLFSSYKRILSM